MSSKAHEKRKRSEEVDKEHEVEIKRQISSTIEYDLKGNEHQKSFFSFPIISLNMYTMYEMYFLL